MSDSFSSSFSSKKVSVKSMPVKSVPVSETSPGRAGKAARLAVFWAVAGGLLLPVGQSLLRAAGPQKPARSSASSPAETGMSSGVETKKHPLDPFLKMADESLRALEKVNDYTALFRNMEMVRGKAFPHVIYLKFRRKPFSVYMYFLKYHRGRQVLYVAGRNQGKLLAREPTIGGLGITVALKPDSPQALAEGRYPITRMGMETMLKAIIEQWQQDKKDPDLKVTFYPNAQLRRPEKTYQPMNCKVLQTVHPQPRPGVEFHMTRLYIDKKTGFPVRVEQYGFPRKPGTPPPLLGEYTYWNVRPNVGLTDADFDRKNPKYRF